MGLTGLSNFATIQVDGGVLAEPMEGTQYIISSNAFPLDFYDRVAPRNDDSISTLFDWNNATQADLDLYVLDSNSNILDSAESGSRYELVNLMNSAPDGDYTIYTSVYSTSIDTIPYKLFIKESSGKQYFIEDVLENAADGDFVALLTFTKSGNSITIQ